jgi:membrane-bound ClpP family serine protease
MDRKDFAFDRVNLILLAIGMAIVVIGFLLMSGGGSTAEQYNPEIFSAVRIKVAPVVCFLGFISMIYAVMRKPKDEGVKEKGEKE